MTPLPSTMKAPGDKRPVWDGGVLQVWVTRACDKQCFGCTQLSNLRGPYGRMTPEQFDLALQSLSGYFGVVGMFGGNPCVHPQFDELCRIMRARVPWHQRGLWSNNLNGHGATCRITFNPARSNLNVHQDQEALAEMNRDWPETVGLSAPQDRGASSDSRHTPVYVAMSDLDALRMRDGRVVENTEANRFRLIADCDVNQYWSAMICVVRGELRAFFCEIAGAMAMAHDLDTGLPVTQGWWRQPMSAFEGQVRKHCHECGFPLRAKGALANGGPDEREQVSPTHVSIFKPKDKNRPVELVTRLEQLDAGYLPRATDYVKNASL